MKSNAKQTGSHSSAAVLQELRDYINWQTSFKISHRYCGYKTPYDIPFLPRGTGRQTCQYLPHNCMKSDRVFLDGEVHQLTRKPKLITER